MKPAAAVQLSQAFKHIHPYIVAYMRHRESVLHGYFFCGSMEMRKLEHEDEDEYAYCDPCPSAKISCVMDGAMTPLREPLGPLPILSMASRNEVPLPSPPDKAKRKHRIKDSGYRLRKVIWSDPVCLCSMLVLVVICTVLLTLLLSAAFSRSSISRSHEETSTAQKVRVDFSVVDQYYAWLRAHDQMYGPTAQRINRQTCTANLKKLRVVLEYVEDNYQNATALSDTSLSSDAEVERQLDKARMEFQRLYHRLAVIDEATGDVVVQPSVEDLKFVLEKYQSHELQNVKYYECRMEAASVRKQLDILQRAMKGTTSTAQTPDLPTEPAPEE